MKNIILLVFLFGFGIVVQAQTTFGLRLTEVSNDGINYVVKIEMQMNGVDVDEFKLGSSSLQFSFSDDELSSPVLQSTTLDSSFPYFTPTVTTPKPGECSFNIELAIPSTGIEIAEAPNWTPLGEVSFTIVNSSLITPLSWSYNGGTTETVVFIDDEATQIFMAEGNTVSIEENNINNSISIFPNPCLGESLMVSLNFKTSQEIQIEVVDNLGRIIYSQEFWTTDQLTKNELIFGQKLSSGLYFVNITGETEKTSTKFVVE